MDLDLYAAMVKEAVQHTKTIEPEERNFGKQQLNDILKKAATLCTERYGKQRKKRRRTYDLEV